MPLLRFNWLMGLCQLSNQKIHCPRYILHTYLRQIARKTFSWNKTPFYLLLGIMDNSLITISL